MDKKQIIIDAIQKKKQLVFFYNEKWREISPHRFGVKHTPSGDDFRVFGMQFDGRDHEGNLVEGKWRCFSVDKCTRVISRVNDGVFHSAPSNGGTSFCMDSITEEVDYG